MNRYYVTFNTKLVNFDRVINAFNVRHCKYLIDRIISENPEYIHVELFSKNGVYSRSRENPWIFQNNKRSL